MNTWTIAGAGLTLVGVLIITGLLPMATVTYVPEEALSVSPGGTEDAPTPVTPGETVPLSASVLAYDRGAGIAIPGWDTPAGWTAAVTVSPGGETVDLADMREYIVGPRVDPLSVTYIWEGEWDVPDNADTLHALSWSVSIVDDGEPIGELTAVTYLIAGAATETPDGYFTINGARADRETTILVTSPELALGFRPTAGASEILGIRVDVLTSAAKIAVVDLVEQTDGSYAASYTLPGPDVYTLNGYILTSGNAIRMMSTVVPLDYDGDGLIDVPEGGDGDGEELDADRWGGTSTLVGGACLMAGLVAILYGSRRR